MNSHLSEAAPLRPFLHPVAVVQVVATSLLTDDRMRPAEAAEHYRVIRQADGGYSAPWSNAVTPYMVEPMNAYAERGVTTIIFVGPAQCAKTTGLIENTLLYGVVCDPADELILAPNEAMARDFSKRKIEPMIRETDELRRRQLRQKGADNLLEKQFAGMIVTIANPTPANVSMRSIPRVKLTDFDRMEDEVGGEGALFSLAQKRAQTFGRTGKAIVESSPGRPIIDPKWEASTPHEAPPTAGILGIYNRGDRRRWYWPCPQCGEFFEASFRDLRWPKDEPDPELAAQQVTMCCPTNGCVIERRHKDGMNAAGMWVPDFGEIVDGQLVGAGRQTTTRSYWLKGPAAAFQDWSQLVLRWLHANASFERTGVEAELEATVTIDQGEAYLPKAAIKGASLDAQALIDRVEPYELGVVPDGVRFLTAGVDVQQNRFVVLVRGWAPDLSSYVIDSFDIYEILDAGERRMIDPPHRKNDWGELTRQVLDARYPLADGSGREMKIAKTAVDSGGAPGTTARSYDWYREVRKRGRRREMMLTKGTATPRAPRLAKTFPDSRGRKDRKADARGEIPVFQFQSNVLKDETKLHLEADLGLPLAVHLSAHLLNEHEPHLFFEELTAEERDDNGKWQRRKRRNEAWDLMVLSHVAALQIGADRIDWDNPPAWCASMDHNSLVIEANKDEPELALEPQDRRPRRGRSRYATNF